MTDALWPGIVRVVKGACLLVAGKCSTSGGNNWELTKWPWLTARQSLIVELVVLVAGRNEVVRKAQPAEDCRPKLALSLTH